MQKFFKQIIVRIVESQARRLLLKHKPRVIAVVGSVGKTSTKLAIATVLSEKYRVMAHYGSYNTPISVPLAMFNEHIPFKLKSPFAWLKVVRDINRKLKKPFDYDVLVLELGSDKPGDLQHFKHYITPDITVITAVAPEHMINFGTLDAVAAEELSIAAFSKLTIINRDDIDARYARLLPEGITIDTYGSSGIAEYHFLNETGQPGQGFQGKFVSPEYGELPVSLQLVGEHTLRSASAAGAVGIKMGLTGGQIIAGLQAIRPVSGRMNLLKGLRDSWIIDDTYNSSPAAAVAALQTLYLFPARQRIAVMGSMNELGAYSQQAHEEVGKMCDPALLEWVVTIGEEAERWLAPMAAGRGCQIRSFANPYDAGAFVHKVLQEEAVLLVKGSQNGVFAEETVKMLLHDPEEERQLVRQTPDWLEIKQRQFEKITQELPE